MKKLLFALALSLFILTVNAQKTMYFKGDWTRLNKTDLFTGIIKITIGAKNKVKGEILWIYLATDESDNFMVEHYKGKKGMQAIEFVEGTYSSSTHDMYFEGKNKTDPNDIISIDKYSLKLSTDKKVLYGQSSNGVPTEGMLYAVQVDGRSVSQQLAAAKVKLKK